VKYIKSCGLGFKYQSNCIILSLCAYAENGQTESPEKMYSELG